MALTPKQQRFVQEYLIDLNATQAAIRAGYSVKSADKIGSQLLGKAGVSQAIEAAQTRRKERTELTQDWVVERLRAEADDHSEDATHSARIRALELLGKHLGMFVDRVEVKQTARLVIEEEIVERDDPPQGASPPGAA